MVCCWDGARHIFFLCVCFSCFASWVGFWEPQPSQLYWTGTGDSTPDIEGASCNCRCGNSQRWKCGLRSTSCGWTLCHTTGCFEQIVNGEYWAQMPIKTMHSGKVHLTPTPFYLDLCHNFVFFSRLAGSCFLFGFIFLRGWQRWFSYLFPESKRFL